MTENVMLVPADAFPPVKILRDITGQIRESTKRANVPRNTRTTVCGLTNKGRFCVKFQDRDVFVEPREVAFMAMSTEGDVQQSIINSILRHGDAIGAKPDQLQGWSLHPEAPTRSRQN